MELSLFISIIEDFVMSVIVLIDLVKVNPPMIAVEKTIIEVIAIKIFILIFIY
jgi:hypothetical protein